MLFIDVIVILGGIIVVEQIPFDRPKSNSSRDERISSHFSMCSAFSSRARVGISGPLFLHYLCKHDANILYLNLYNEVVVSLRKTHVSAVFFYLHFTRAHVHNKGFSSMKEEQCHLKSAQNLSKTKTNTQVRCTNLNTLLFTVYFIN